MNNTKCETLNRARLAITMANLAIATSIAAERKVDEIEIVGVDDDGYLFLEMV